jgi:hypothetical protein
VKCRQAIESQFQSQKRPLARDKQAIPFGGFELGGEVRIGTSGFVTGGFVAGRFVTGGFVTGGDGTAAFAEQVPRHLGVADAAFEPGV